MCEGLRACCRGPSSVVALTISGRVLEEQKKPYRRPYAETERDTCTETDGQRVREQTREYQSSNEVTAAAAYSARTMPGGASVMRVAHAVHLNFSPRIPSFLNFRAIVSRSESAIAVGRVRF
ncbi:hypothetical protein QTP88_017754 [Uroleucon formosanum]